MIAISTEWGEDLAVSPTGDIATISIDESLSSRIVRRMLTNPGDYIWHVDYGAGLGRYVGQPYSPRFVGTAIQNQLRFESLVAITPAPNIEVSQSLNDGAPAISVSVQFQNARSSENGSVILTAAG